MEDKNVTKESHNQITRVMDNSHPHPREGKNIKGMKDMPKPTMEHLEEEEEMVEMVTETEVMKTRMTQEKKRMILMGFEPEEDEETTTNSQ